MGSGAVLGLAPAPEYTFLIYVSPVGNYFKVMRRMINFINFYDASCALNSLILNLLFVLCMLCDNDNSIIVHTLVIFTLSLLLSTGERLNILNLTIYLYLRHFFSFR